ncbi:TGS domain-containing protein, partial [Candidatus Pacearchaeota archaeon]|nr:TGS domain-containing protein [Candidatus Pacearchaeota archaeon]MBD3283269.1 TGS domain-containing protein [Candidatus Pacearchaeota archaeon]
AKLKYTKEKESKKAKGTKGLKKEEMQAVLLGLTNSGKSSLLKRLTNADPKIASYGFTTQKPEIGTLKYENCNIQLIELPPIASEGFDKGILNNTDLIIIVVEKIDEIQSILKEIKSKDLPTSRIIAFNKIDRHDENAKRKISETLKSKGYKFVLTSTVNEESIEELKKKIFKSFDIIRIYTRQPGKKEDNVPVILPPESTVKDVAEKILHGYSKKVKYAKIWGPSSKFPGQKIGLKHIVKDKDILEFYTD